jgi:hypothetical protein
VIPVAGPGELRERQGLAYTWAILMDPRIQLLLDAVAAVFEFHDLDHLAAQL